MFQQILHQLCFQFILKKYVVQLIHIFVLKQLHDNNNNNNKNRKTVRIYNEFKFNGFLREIKSIELEFVENSRVLFSSIIIISIIIFVVVVVVIC